MTRFLLVVCAILSNIGLLLGQTPLFCGHDLLEHSFHQHHPSYTQKVDGFDRQIKQLILDQRADISRSNDTILYTIPTVYHVLWNHPSEDVSDVQIYQELEYLNRAFRNIGYYDSTAGVDVRIEFCLANLDPDGNSTSGIEHIQTPLGYIQDGAGDFAMKAAFNWDPNRYFNVYVAGLLLGGGVAGYAYYPTSAGEYWDGVVMLYSYVGRNEAASSVMVHEVGHYLGLPHTFDRGCENDDCLLQGDRVCDTPPDAPAVFFEGCQIFNNCTTDTADTSPNNPFTTDVPDMNNNYMDYNDTYCSNAFTAGQSERMRLVLTNIRGGLLESDVCRTPSPFDAGIAGVENLDLVLCDSDQALGVVVRNFGLVNLFQTDLVYQIDQGPLDTISWAGNLFYTEQDTVSLSLPAGLSPGNHLLSLYTSMPNANLDLNPINDTLRLAFTFRPTQVAPFVEGFELGIPDTWTIDNPGGLGWQQVALGCDSSGNNQYCLSIDNTVTHLNGTIDGLVSPIIDLRYAIQPRLSFDVAYAYTPVPGTREELIVSVSTDCGQTFFDPPLYIAAENTLATASTSTDTLGIWQPQSCEDWGNTILDLSAYEGEEILIRFDLNKYDNGFPFYLDNIQINGLFVTDIEQASPISDWKIYPNPNPGSFVVEMDASTSEQLQLSVFDLMGRKVQRHALRTQVGRNAIPVDMSEAAKGIYLLELKVGERQEVRRVIVE